MNIRNQSIHQYHTKLSINILHLNLRKYRARKERYLRERTLLAPRDTPGGEKEKKICKEETKRKENTKKRKRYIEEITSPYQEDQFPR